jgi:competence protein ComEC
MTTLVDVSGAPILHFDAGWPIGFNRKTYPKNEPSAPFANLVVLSHWDWDHLHGYHKWPGIRNAIWCVPDQELGLNAKLVAEDLMNRKRLILVPPGRRTSFQFNSIQIILVDPPLAGSKSVLRNNSGIAMLVETTVGGIVLLPGDADYARFYSLCAKPPDRLVVSHHGADVHGAIPPAPAPGGRGVVRADVRRIPHALPGGHRAGHRLLSPPRPQ